MLHTTVASGPLRDRFQKQPLKKNRKYMKIIWNLIPFYIIFIRHFIKNINPIWKWVLLFRLNVCEVYVCWWLCPCDVKAKKTTRLLWTLWRLDLVYWYHSIQSRIYYCIVLWRINFMAFKNTITLWSLFEEHTSPIPPTHTLISWLGVYVCVKKYNEFIEIFHTTLDMPI